MADVFKEAADAINAISVHREGTFVEGGSGPYVTAREGKIDVKDLPPNTEVDAELFGTTILAYTRRFENKKVKVSAKDVKSILEDSKNMSWTPDRDFIVSKEGTVKIPRLPYLNFKHAEVVAGRVLHNLWLRQQRL